jgi:hypothetical protein
MFHRLQEHIKMTDNQTSAQICAKPMSVKNAAALMNVSVRSVQFAIVALNHGCPELIAAMEAGEVTSSLAAKFVKTVPDRAAQAEIIAQGLSAIRLAVKLATAPKPTADVDELLALWQSLDAARRADLLSVARSLAGKRP